MEVVKKVTPRLVENKQEPKVYENLSPAEVIRSFAGPIMTYSAQRFILFEDVPCPTEEHDLQFIKQQVYKNLTM